MLFTRYSGGPRRATGAASECSLHGRRRVPRVQGRVAVPEPGVDYEIRYHQTPFVDYFPLQSNQTRFGGLVVDPSDRGGRIRAFYEDKSNNAATKHLAYVKSLPKGQQPPAASTLYINFTEVNAQLKAAKPVTFKWDVRSEGSPRVTNVVFTYRLDPIEDWQLYSPSREVTYEFLSAGNYTFCVRAKYEIDGRREESRIANDDFRLTKRIFALSKSPVTTRPESTFFSEEHYATSRALLIGVTRYQDRSFVALPFVSEDLREFESCSADVWVPGGRARGAHGQTGFLQVHRGAAHAWHSLQGAHDLLGVLGKICSRRWGEHEIGDRAGVD